MGVPKLIKGNGQEVPEKKQGNNQCEAYGFRSEGPGILHICFLLYTNYIIVIFLLVSCMNTNNHLLYLCSVNRPIVIY